MEDSLDPSLREPVASKGTKDTPDEESGWTSYFEDFLYNQRENSSCYDNSFCGTSLVSDAASFIEWKVSNNKELILCSSMGGSRKYSTQLNFKKTRTKVSYDDSLEDTASSPVNSPKVGSLKQMDINQRKTDDNIESSLGKGGRSDRHLEQQTDGRNEPVLEGKNSDCIHLRKRGLCLVPLSMLVNSID